VELLLLLRESQLLAKVASSWLTVIFSGCPPSLVLVKQVNGSHLQKAKTRFFQTLFSGVAGRSKSASSLLAS
jgi:hypothetical protein